MKVYSGLIFVRAVQILRYILEQIPADKRVDLPYHFGWPWQWYQLLYSHPFDMQLHFQLPLQGSAVLGHAKIGMAILGKKVGPTLYKATAPIRM
ncbi:hypothetical protein THIOM_000359 [Candidatus Thiomargarita nelsonii]|uniref:Uncharacterized protein n=1 Tax=Candidatus Thiomargarita nelsonii TaxID=1003181 RepID=A0A176S7B9_9GAMM|nr:hypothetical protein THIOM_000359 [Candidatus Thiomargarita nelsonii]